MRVAEVHGSARVGRQFLVAGYVFALVVGQRLAYRLGDGIELVREGLVAVAVLEWGYKVGGTRQRPSLDSECIDAQRYRCQIVRAKGGKKDRGQRQVGIGSAENVALS